MKALIKTAWLFLIFSLGSVGFVLIADGMGNPLSYGDEEAITALILAALAFVVEMVIYKFAYKKWRLTLLNWAIAHFAAFFSFIAYAVCLIADLGDDIAAYGALVVWLPIAYLCQFHVLYVERLERIVKEQKNKIETFDQEKAKIDRKITQMKTKLDNQQRYGK